MLDDVTLRKIDLFLDLLDRRTQSLTVKKDSLDSGSFEAEQLLDEKRAKE